jgi:hypothetical protein
MGNAGGYAQVIMSGLGRVIEWVTPFASTLASVFGTIIESVANVTGAIIDFINRSEGLPKRLRVHFKQSEKLPAMFLAALATLLPVSFRMT